ncbi:transposase [Mycolicibacterium sp. CH28]|jgi:DNA-binding IclR family transcriptional regulator|uniref:DUF6262 family protein n=2 Tax=Mycolicibacterium sp. CH28 TaxID=2512237 RepID=UPI0010807A85|nr:DUF6262 family protein [Mycolicibacterium sp. CH28]TGD88562.1 transposase [Mycolicibacterium sp. CH28]
MHADGSARLARAAQARHEQTLQRARTVLQSIAEGDSLVTVAGLARRAGVSRSWLYTQPELLESIEQLRQHNRNETTPAANISNADTRASTDSLRRRLELAHEHIGQLRTENRELRDALARAHGLLRGQNLTT